jgi:hypothetical protein
MENKSVRAVTRDVESFLDFLYDKGFKLSSTAYSPHPNGSWVVKFKSQECMLYITSDRDRISADFYPLDNINEKHRISIEKIIYILSGGNEIISPFKGNLAWSKRKQLERLSKLLNKYIDQITIYYDNKSKDEPG